MSYSQRWTLEVSEETRLTFDELGSFGPTITGKNLKGYLSDWGKTYWDEDELRRMAAAFLEVADWLKSLSTDTSTSQGDE